MRTEIKGNILYFNYKRGNDLIEGSCDLGYISPFYIEKLQAISKNNNYHQKDMRITTKEILKILEEKAPEYFI